MLDNCGGIDSKETGAANCEDSTFECEEVDRLPTIEAAPCLKCSSNDQIEGLDRIHCLCTIPYQLAYGHYPRHRRDLGEVRDQMRFDNPGQLYNYINKCRQWVQVWSPKGSADAKAQFSLTTYNILAQNLLLNHLYLYQGNTKSDLMWSQRGERLRRELLDMNSDIYCLQEVHLENFKAAILPSLVERGYQAVFKRKTGTALDGCSIIFKTDKFRLQDCLEVEFNRQDISHLLDKDNVALVVKLCPVGLGRPVDTNLIVANTHLLFNPKRGDIKIAQLRLLFAEIQRFALKKGTQSLSPAELMDPLKYFPVIFCGDMNSEPTSPLVNFIKNGRQNFDGLLSGDISGQREGLQRGRQMLPKDLLLKGINPDSCYDDHRPPSGTSEAEGGDLERDLTIRHVFNLKSVYPMVDEFSKQLVSMSTFLDTGLVDHIFYSYRHPNLRLSAFRQLLTKRDLNAIGHLPNAILGSDHLALSAKFYIL